MGDMELVDKAHMVAAMAAVVVAAMAGAKLDTSTHGWLFSQVSIYICC